LHKGSTKDRGDFPIDDDEVDSIKTDSNKDQKEISHTSSDERNRWDINKQLEMIGSSSHSEIIS